MAEAHYLSLLKKIALGVPLVAGPLLLSGCWWGSDCGDSERETVVVAETPDGGSDCWGQCPYSSPTGSGKTLVSCTMSDGGMRANCDYAWECLGGRRPDERGQARVRGALDARGRWCLEMAVAEAASVPAFRALAAALEAHGAPAALIRRALESADDEARHTRMALELAGHGEIRVRVPPAPIPSREALACANAAEGCVREAYAALEMAWQAKHADDPRARELFGAIARDEARHALLSHDIDRWLEGSVDAEAVARARAEALEELRAAFLERARPDGLGIPDAPTATSLLALAA